MDGSAFGDRDPFLLSGAMWQIFVMETFSILFFGGWALFLSSFFSGCPIGITIFSLNIPYAAIGCYLLVSQRLVLSRGVHGTSTFLTTVAVPTILQSVQFTETKQGLYSSSNLCSPFSCGWYYVQTVEISPCSFLSK